MQALIPIFIQLAAGTLGGIIAGQALRGRSLGVIINAAAGALGGGICAFITTGYGLIGFDASQFAIIVAVGLTACAFLIGAGSMYISGTLNRRFRR